MVVAVQRPRAKDSDIDTLLKGIQIAGGILGIKSNLEQSSLRAAQELRAETTFEAQEAERARVAAERERKAAGILTPSEELSIAPQFRRARPGEAGAVPGFKIGEEDVAFVPRAADEAEKKATQIAQKIAKEKKDTKLKRESDLRREYSKSSIDTKDALTAYRKVEAAALAETPTGADDVALIFNFMKTIDPGSTVREGEFATAEQTAGVPAQVAALYNRAITGERLTPGQRTNFLTTARSQMLSQLKIQENTDQNYSKLSSDAEVDIEDVINPLFAKALDQLSRQSGQAPRQDLIGQRPRVGLPLGFGEAGAAEPRPRGEKAVDSLLEGL